VASRRGEVLSFLFFFLLLDDDHGADFWLDEQY
jgi:hypothetical protein